MKKTYVGIDITKDLGFCMIEPEKTTYHDIKNKVTAIRKLLKIIAKLAPEAFICMGKTSNITTLTFKKF